MINYDASRQSTNNSTCLTSWGLNAFQKDTFLVTGKTLFLLTLIGMMLFHILFRSYASSAKAPLHMAVTLPIKKKMKMILLSDFHCYILYLTVCMYVLVYYFVCLTFILSFQGENEVFLLIRIFLSHFPFPLFVFLRFHLIYWEFLGSHFIFYNTL